MRSRILLFLLGAVLIALCAWFTFATLATEPARFMLEVPASYLSVGQQFEPRLVTEAGPAGGEVSLSLLDGAGRSVSSATATLGPAGAGVEAPPFSLPRAGSFELRAELAGSAPAATLALNALDDPGAHFGGVVGLAALGLAPGISDYLRQHGFAVEPLGLADVGDNPPRLILVGDSRLLSDGDPAPFGARYAALWRAVGAGASMLALEPPTAGMAAEWPLTLPLLPATADCGAQAEDGAFAGDLAPPPPSATGLLRPLLGFDLSHASAFDLYRLDGTRLPRPNRHAGYSGCFPLVSYRLGAGWVTVSTVPILEHFQDARARSYLLQLISAAIRRKRSVPASPGLLWIVQHRPAPAQSPGQTLAAVFLRPPPDAPASVEPAPMLVPLGESSAGCWAIPARAGEQVTLDWGGPPSAANAALNSVQLDFGPERTAWPPAFDLAASHTGTDWVGLAPASPNASGQPSVPLPPSPAVPWREIRLRLTADGTRSWSLCQFSLAPSPAH